MKNNKSASSAVLEMIGIVAVFCLLLWLLNRGPGQ